MRIKYANIETVKSTARTFKKWFGVSQSQALDKVSRISGYRNYAEVLKFGPASKGQETCDIFWDDDSVREVQAKLGDVDFYKLQNFLMKFMQFSSQRTDETTKFLSQFKAFRSGIVFVVGQNWLKGRPGLLEKLFHVQNIMASVENPAPQSMRTDTPELVAVLNGPNSQWLHYQDLKGPYVYFPANADCSDIYEYIDRAFCNPELRYPGDILFVRFSHDSLDITEVQRCGYDIVSHKKIMEAVDTVCALCLSTDGLWADRSKVVFPLLCGFLKPYFAKKGENLTIYNVLDFIVGASSESSVEATLKKWDIKVKDFVAAMNEYAVHIKKDDYIQFRYTLAYSRIGLAHLLDKEHGHRYGGNEVIV